MNDPELLPIVKEPKALVLKKEEPFSLAHIGKMLQEGLKTENVEAVRALVELAEHVEDRNAKKAFAQCLKDLQDECKKVVATKAVPNNDGSVRYTYAPYEEIMDQVQPMLTAHGFTVSFSTRIDEGRITKVCKLCHVSGHSETNEFTVRIGKGPPGVSETQADGAAHTYAKRGALCDCLNIRIEKPDNDARNLGAFITIEQAQTIKDLIESTRTDTKKLLAFAQAESVEKIGKAQFDMLFGWLKKKERK